MSQRCSQMATLRIPHLTIGPAYRARDASSSGESADGNCHFQVFFGLSADGDVVSPKPSGAVEDASKFEYDCSPIEERAEAEEVPTREASPPTPNPEHTTFESTDLPLPKYTSRLCLSPPPMASRTVSIDADCGRSVSSASSRTSASDQGENTHTSDTPCNCPFVEARRMTEAAKTSILRHYKKHATIVTYPNGRQIPIVRQWMLEHINTKMEFGYKTAVSEVKRIAEAANPGSWPVHHGGRPCRGYLGRVQPWMRALTHRILLEAGNEALADIDHREGMSDKELPAFELDFPGVLAQNTVRPPCLCKEAHTISIATRILEQTMTRLAPLISMLAACMSNKDRAALHERVWHRINGQIHLAMIKALRDIGEDSDIGRRCAEHEMTHVQPWMTETIKQHCESVARVERKRLQWKARELQITRLQKWLEQLYLEEKEDEKNGESAQQEPCSVGTNDHNEDDNDNESREDERRVQAKEA